MDEEIEKIRIQTNNRDHIKFILKVIVSNYFEKYISYQNKINKEKFKFIFKVYLSKFIVLIHNNYLKIIKSIKGFFILLQTFITVLILSNIAILLASKDPFPEDNFTLYLSGIVSIIAIILLFWLMNDKFLWKTEKSLFFVLSIEILYFPIYLLSSSIDWTISIPIKEQQLPFVINMGNSLIYIFTFIILITSLIMAPQVVKSALGRKGFKNFNLPFIIPSTYPVTPDGIEKHMKYIDNMISKPYNQINYWNIEYFSVPNNENYQGMGAVMISYPSKFKMGKAYPISIYINKTNTNNKSFGFILDSPDFEPASSTMKLNENAVSFLFLSPKKSGETNLTLRIISSKENDICGINLLSNIEKDISIYLKNFIGIGTLLLYVIEIIFGYTIIK